ncbi:pilin [Pokkaliibacter sp. MBI-7]|nr:pilin [Pokkaliibacter sp. MBI-7]MDH2436395.1 pilin [Pokkaliibacter sp. MBI-7]
MGNKAQAGFTLIELMIVVAIIGILAAIAIPQYQNYVAKSQASRVMDEAGSLKTAVESCILDGRTTIGTAAGQCDPGATGSTLLTGATQGTAVLPAGTGVPQVAITAATGAATITATLGGSATSQLSGDTLVWSRDTTGTWTCTSSIDVQWRPTGCTANNP